MAKAGKTSTIKYADKSAGQPELIPVFDELKKLLSGFVKGNYIAKDDSPGNYSVYYNKPVEINGRVYPDLPMAGVLIQKGYVGFYYFCIYTRPEMKQDIPKELLKHLKGKTCFHFRNADPQLLQQLKATVDKGYRYYLSMGWK